MKNCSPDWQKVSLGDHVDLLAGFAFKSARFTDKPSDTTLVKGADVQQGYIDWPGCKRWPANDVTSYEKYRLQSDDVVLAMDRPWVPAGLKYGWIKKGDPECLLVQRVARLRGRSCLTSVFLRYLIGSPDFEDYIRPIVTGVNVPHISGKQIEAFKFRLPPRSHQLKIHAILSVYDDLIENNLRRIQILEEMAQNLYREWFVNFRFPGHESVCALDSPLGPIPEGWRVMDLEDVIDEIIDYRGKTPKKLGGAWSDEGIIALSAKNIKNGRLVNIDQAKRVSTDLYEKWMKSELRQYDILLTSEAPLGELYFLAKPGKYCLSQRLYALRADPKVIWPSLLYYQLTSAGTQAQMRERSTGTTVLGIRQSLLRKVPIVVPSRELQCRSGKFFDYVVHFQTTLVDMVTTLIDTRDLLLPKLISGELDVSDLDIAMPEEAA